MAANHPEFWNLPVDVADSNSTVGFEVDTTWHMVHGATGGLSGKIWLAEPADYHSVRGEVTIPVLRLDTDSSSRDERLREVMAAEQFPEVVFRVTGVEDLCNPADLSIGERRPVVLVGTLKIRGVERAVRIAAHISTLEGLRYGVAGEFTFPWAAFGVEDPSIFVARVDPDVTVRFDLVL